MPGLASCGVRRRVIRQGSLSATSHKPHHRIMHEFWQSMRAYPHTPYGVHMLLNHHGLAEWSNLLFRLLRSTACCLHRPCLAGLSMGERGEHGEGVAGRSHNWEGWQEEISGMRGSASGGGELWLCERGIVIISSIAPPISPFPTGPFLGQPIQTVPNANPTNISTSPRPPLLLASFFSLLRACEYGVHCSPTEPTFQWRNRYMHPVLSTSIGIKPFGRP